MNVFTYLITLDLTNIFPLFSKLTIGYLTIVNWYDKELIIL